MSIKVTGTTVINDSREVENIADINKFIRTPEVLSPTNGSTDQNLGKEIEGSVYSPLYTVDERLYREFQIDLDSGDFTSLERTNQVNADSWIVTPLLSPDTLYKVRIRDISVNGTVSEWSEAVSFLTINVFVDEPSVSVEFGPSDVRENPTISTSSFSVTNGSDTHLSTDWEVIRTSDSVKVFESLNDTSNLTSIVVPDGNLDDGSVEYEFRARHRGNNFGTSNFGSVTATTRDEFFTFTSFGQSGAGGFYIGTIGSYYLIVAPNSTGCDCKIWDSRTFIPDDGGKSNTDGFSNTYNFLGLKPAIGFAASLTINGFDDWYLPARNELLQLYNNQSQLPSGEGVSNSQYWSSTSHNSRDACFIIMDTGVADRDTKKITSPVRAIRREPI